MDNKRFHMLDTLRGIMIIGVVLSHFLVDLDSYGVAWATSLLYNPIIEAISVVGRILFVLLAGICTHLSHNNLRRGLIVAGAAAVISIATLAVDVFFFGEIGYVFIYMGILHLLAVCMLLYALIEPLFKGKSLPDPLTWLLFIMLAALFAATYNLSTGKLGFYSINTTDTLLGAILGTGVYPELISADSFPIIPWTFIFFAGALLGKYFKEDRVPAFLHKNICPPLSYIGRKTLIIYLLHQPLIYGIAVLIGNIN